MSNSLLQSQPTTEINTLIKTLKAAEAKKKNGPFFCKKTNYPVGESGLSIDSWKFQDWDYKKNVLPTCARGLFTYRDPISGNHVIAARGYDKFFNIDEVQRTEWDWIEKHTKAPYEVTLKENGCIIFVSGLPDDTLLVCSKHSIGVRKDDTKSHALAGEKWIDHQLAGIGKTRKDLARALREANITAVAELCDDSFEEHILAYEGDQAGLYLHGVNLRTPTFATYPAAEVHKFADQWGFRKIEYFEKQDTKSLREFLEYAAETGSWEGKDVEGFVIRCKARHGPEDTEWHDWFFKYKFEEPYLMYRQWRECTKALTTKKGPKIRKHQAITKEYLEFAATYFKQNPGAYEQYMQNHGIIKLRNAFLAHKKMKGSDIIRNEVEEEGEGGAGESYGNDKVIGNVVLTSVGTIGCGKTTVARGLCELFGWGHVQNDDISGKRGKSSLFASAVSKELRKYPVVFADRNNHQKRERDQLFKDVSHDSRDARYVAIHYVHTPDNLSRIRKATKDRVFGRGDNHQTIQAASRSKEEVESIMAGFIDRFQPVDTNTQPDSEFDGVIDLDPAAGSRINLEIVVSELKTRYPRLIEKLPSSEDYNRAFNAALSYAPTSRQVIQPRSHIEKATPAVSNTTKGKNSIEYFGLTVPTEPIISALTSTFEGQPEGIGRFWKQLNSTNRVQRAFHVTLIHNANSGRFPDVWRNYQNLLASAGSPSNLGKGILVLKNVVWNQRLMAVEVGIMGDEFKATNANPHITIGTANGTIKPVESNLLLDQWKSGTGPKAQFLELDGRQIEGTAVAVERRRR